MVSQQSKRPLVRKKFVSNARAQFKIVIFLATLSLVMAALLCIVAYWRLNDLNYMITHSMMSPAEFPAAFRMQTNKMFLQILGLVVLMTAAFTALGLFLTHNITGPIYKLTFELRKFLEAGGEGKFHLKFRESDEFQDLPPLINELASKYKK